MDYIPRRSPLFDLIEANLDKAKMEGYKASWKHQETDFDRFPASQMVELKDYAKKVSKKKKAEARMQRWEALAKKRPEIGKVLSSIGMLGDDASKKPKEKTILNVP